MAILRRIENILEGRLIRHSQSLDYDSLMNILSVLEKERLHPLFHISFVFPPHRENPILVEGASIGETRRFIQEFMQPHDNYRVRGSQEGYYGKFSEKHYIEMKKFPSVIFMDKYGNDEYPEPAKRRKMEDMLAMSELSLSYLVERR